MTLGEKLKQLRQEKGLSQPELATEAGIEQSYLSKLENDKSLPSNDILRKILAAFQVSLADLISDELVQKDIQRFKQIPDVEQYLAQQSQNQFIKRRNLLLAASICMVIAVTLFYAGKSKLLFNEHVYQYESLGVIYDNEPDSMFTRWSIDYFPHRYNDNASEQIKQEYQKLKLEIARRYNKEYQLTSNYLGEQYRQQVDGGRRVYKYTGTVGFAQTRSINGWLQILGVLLFSIGIMGFVLERRLFK
ncbi:helix-turn-helix domain-containing protein [Pseudoalteromonas sp. G4]|uniref:helix-turn-helix domain-containing protein n=1 Tax=Pseudoalteromonas sp. G4 TaxID=2992761 RepID=UPI00237D5995|nr:helix-turn-helix domain-containing protein [Pseudoalteromonas sp. G4]MDE3272679.1 helix-turn-helix domain-containing protein [Pseudoalteromonas sp. G4]